MKRILNFISCAVAASSIFIACEDPKPEVKPEISATPTSVIFSAEGETKNIAISTNVDNWTYSGQPDWVSVVADGNELKLTASANNLPQERTGSITLTAESVTCKIELKQNKGEKYPGYTELSICEANYAGSLYQMFLPNCEGGDATIEMESEDGRTCIFIEFFTPEYLTAEEVELPVGEYTAGDRFEDFVDFDIQGVPMTYVSGGSYILTDEYGEEEFNGGTSITYVTGETSETKYIKSGKFTISQNENGTYLIKTDLVDEDDNEIKYYYEGEIIFDTEDALFPNSDEDIDPTVITSADFIYYGDSGEGTTKMSLTLTAESEALTTIEYYIPLTDFENITDLSGTFEAPEGENDYSEYSICKGSLIEMEGFSFPMGTFIMFQFGDYFIADGESMLMIIKNEDGSYTIMANIQNTDESDEGYLIMVENITVTLTDGTAIYEEL